MRLSEFLTANWKPALGCTEPAAVAWAAAMGADLGEGPVRGVRLACDSRTFKNCHAVGLPNTGRQTGILLALAIGAHLPDPSLGLRSFEAVTPEILAQAQDLLDRGQVQVEVDSHRTELWLDVTVFREGGTGRAVVEREHDHLTRLERDGVPLPVDNGAKGRETPPDLERDLASMGIGHLMDMARSATQDDRGRLREGVAMNLAMARHGVSLMPAFFSTQSGQDAQTRISRLVSAGVFARMSGEPLPVMTLAGSGNKGITVSVPFALWGIETAHAQSDIEEALAFACLMTALTTHHLGTLSAICGAANAAGIGIASGLILLQGGNASMVELAIHTMVGNLAGMVCDGAKIGCAMKTMTGVEAAFRASSLALAGIGIPPTDGIVGRDAQESLANLGRLARRGMAGVDVEILDIMRSKLSRDPNPQQAH